MKLFWCYTSHESQLQLVLKQLKIQKKNYILILIRIRMYL